MKTIIGYITLSLVPLFCIGCLETQQLQMPAGYVSLEDPYDQFAQRAVNAEKCMIALRVEDNLKNATTNFWADTITSSLTARGYELYKRENIQASSQLDGVLLEFTQQDMTYWIAVFLRSGKVYMVEAGGETKAFSKQQADVIKTIKSLKI